MTSSRFSQRFWSRDSFAAGQTKSPAETPRSRTLDRAVAEVILACESRALRCACATTAGKAGPRGIFVPENYEPNYAYPLVVWLHDAGRSERDIAQVLPRISMRNYLGLSLRGTRPLRGEPSAAYCWPRSERARLAFQDSFRAGVRELRHDFHVHTERIFLVGAGDGASMAWELFLARPAWFAGLAVLGGRFPRRRSPLRQFREMRNKRLFLSPATHDTAELDEANRVGRLMYAAGLDVRICSHAPMGRLAPSLLRQLDYWIMEAIGGCL